MNLINAISLFARRLEVFGEDIDAAIRCRKRRRWLICTPWLAIPGLWGRSLKSAQWRDQLQDCRFLKIRARIEEWSKMIDAIGGSIAMWEEALPAIESGQLRTIARVA